MLRKTPLEWVNAHGQWAKNPNDHERCTELRRAFNHRLGPDDEERVIEAAIAEGDAALLKALYPLWRGRHSVEIKKDPDSAPALRQLERMAAVIAAAKGGASQ